MLEALYEFLTGLGYHHPLHPPLTHLPLGMVTGAFIFGSIACFLKHSALRVSAHHCMTLALCSLFPTVLMGYADWQRHYQGAMFFEIQAKIVLATALLPALSIAIALGRRHSQGSLATVWTYALCLLLTGALGYLGGELVFRGRTPNPELSPPMAREGESIFKQSCSGCHLADSNESKFGPGLKGLFKGDGMLSSGKPVSEENVRRQITAPSGMMPPFTSFTPHQMEALIAYLRRL